MNKPAIVIVAWNRPASLKRLLTSLERADYGEGEVSLHISLDANGDPEVARIARDHQWPYGPKKVEVAEEHLGLKQHILRAGELTKEYGSIILLEDDLFVSPGFYNYACAAQNYYASDSDVAGISLYNYEIAESCAYPFRACCPANGVYFMQVASSWGQLWTDAQWKGFQQWFEKTGDSELDRLPMYVRKWGANSWKKYFINYLVSTGRYFVFPAVSFTTNFEDQGTNATTTDLFQVPLTADPVEINFHALTNSPCRYDAWFEMQSQSINLRTDLLKDYDYEVDLYGQKEVKKPYVLTSRPGSEAVLQFSDQMHPLILNVLHEAPGVGLGLYPKDRIDTGVFPSHKLISQSFVQQVRHDFQHLISLDVVIPLEKFVPERLLQTIGDHITDRRICFHIVSSAEIFPEVKAWLADRQWEGLISLKSAESAHLLDVGFSGGRGELVTWLRPGSRLAPDAPDQLAKIFNGFAQVNWVSGVAYRTSGAPVNTAPYRWNAHMVERDPERSALVDTELMFMRRSLINRIGEQRTKGNTWFADLISAEPLFVAAWVFGERSGPGKKHKHEVRVGKEVTGWKKWFGKAGYRTFLKNRSPQRLFFLEAEQLPFVLQYDDMTQSFYVARY